MHLSVRPIQYPMVSMVAVHMIKTPGLETSISIRLTAMVSIEWVIIVSFSCDEYSVVLL